MRKSGASESLVQAMPRHLAINALSSAERDQLTSHSAQLRSSVWSPSRSGQIERVTAAAAGAHRARGHMHIMSALGLH